tara:strand:+ start:211 stop:984 length:774 start_codon:yes stop_codon:yes gene_type:complete
MTTIEANGEKIFFVDEGNGPPILFIHSLGTNSYLFRDQVADLKNNFRCIVPDCRGHGASSFNGSFSIEECAADLKAVLDQLNVDSCHLVGLSMGGPIGLCFNRLYPDVALSITFANSFARLREGSEDRIYATQEAVAYLSMLEFGSQYAGDQLMPTTPIEKLDELAQEISKCPPKSYVSTIRALLTYDASSDLKLVTTPTLIIAGQGDEATPITESEFIRDGISGSEIKIIDGAGHLSTIDRPEEFTEVLRTFLQSQ